MDNQPNLVFPKERTLVINILRYWKKTISCRKHLFGRHNRVRKLVIVASLGALSGIFQSAGGLLPGIGFVISPLATAPIVIAALLSVRSGIAAYFLTICLLTILQPSELIIFPFSTGLLGLGIGLGFTLLKSRISITMTGTLLLLAGVYFVFYGLKFPILGPTMSTPFNIGTTLMVFFFCFVYSWIWIEFSLKITKRLSKTIVKT